MFPVTVMLHPLHRELVTRKRKNDSRQSNKVFRWLVHKAKNCCFVGKAKLRAFISTNLSEQEVGEGEIAKWEE